MMRVGSEKQFRECQRTENIVVEDGTRLFVRDWGEGRPVLFLSGWTLPSDFWGYQMVATVREGYRAVAYDRRGHGRSSDPGTRYDHDTLSDDLAQVIETLGLDDVVLISHSMGSTEIARYFARHGRGRVSKVVLVSAITPCIIWSETNPSGLYPPILEQLRAPMAIDFPAWIAANSEPFFVQTTSPSMIAWGQSLMLQTSLLAVIEMARANAETDFRADVAKIDVPTLLIHGDMDVSAPLALTGRPTQTLIRGSQIRVYEGAPHGLPLTHSRRLSADIGEFLKNG